MAETQSDLAVARIVRDNKAYTWHEIAMALRVKHVGSLRFKLVRLVEEGRLEVFGGDRYAPRFWQERLYHMNQVDGEGATGPGGIIFKESALNSKLLPYRVFAVSNTADPIPGRWNWICDPLFGEEAGVQPLEHADGKYSQMLPRPSFASGPARDFAVVRANHENKIWIGRPSSR